MTETPLTQKFRVGITRDILDSRGEPAFGRGALAILDGAPDIEWEYLTASVTEVDADLAARYDAIYVEQSARPGKRRCARRLPAAPRRAPWRGL